MLVNFAVLLKRQAPKLRSKSLCISAFLTCVFVIQPATGQDEPASEPTKVLSVPYMPSSNDRHTGALRVINHSKEDGVVTIVGFDDEGTEYGPATLTVGSQDSRLLYTDDLENGSSSVNDGIGRGVGSWRLTVSSKADIEATAFAVSTDGLLAGLQETVPGENGCWRIPMFYSADNLTTSSLRLTNANEDAASVKISGRDDRGAISANPIELKLPPNVTRTYSSADLEGGTSDFAGTIGNGSGNWQLAVESDRLITVMNLIAGDRLTSNVSSRADHAIGHCWLGKTLANADRSIIDQVEIFTAPDRLEEKSPITPAIYAAIVDETGIRAITATGIKKMGEDAEASIHDRLYLGSITKPMTATMIGTLIFDQPSVFTNGWDTTIGSVFDDRVEEIHSDYQNVTIKQLLTHYGRVAEYLEDWEDDPTLSIVQRRENAVIQALTKASIINEGNVSYSHVGYMVAGAMAERLTGQTWQQLMQERLFDPLGMASAGFGPPALIQGGDEPWGHTLSEDSEWIPTQEDWEEVLRPTASVHASMEDLGKFLQLWMDDKEPMLLNRAQIHALTRLAVNEDGTLLRFLFSGGSPSAGWWLYQDVFGFGEALNTPGSNGNWYSMVWVMRDISRAYLVVTNSVLPDETYGTRASINRVLTPVITRLATSPARSLPPQLAKDVPH